MPNRCVELNRILHDLYDRAGYDLRINYSGDATPPLEGDDAALGGHPAARCWLARKPSDYPRMTIA